MVAIKSNTDAPQQANTLENDGGRLFPEMDDGTQISAVESAKEGREEKKNKGDFNPNKASSYYSKTSWMARSLKVTQK